MLGTFQTGPHGAFGSVTVLFCVGVLRRLTLPVEDGDQDPIHAGLSWKVSNRSRPSPKLAQSSFDCVDRENHRRQARLQDFWDRAGEVRHEPPRGASVNLPRGRSCIWAGALPPLWSVSRVAQAQAIRRVGCGASLDGSPAGGPTDIFMRLVGQPLSERLGNHSLSKTGQEQPATLQPKRSCALRPTAARFSPSTRQQLSSRSASGRPI
jgi:hypothetical protein